MARREGVRTRNPVTHDQEFRAADSPRIRTHTLISKIPRTVVNFP